MLYNVRLLYYKLYVIIFKGLLKKKYRGISRPIEGISSLPEILLLFWKQFQPRYLFGEIFFAMCKLFVIRLMYIGCNTRILLFEFKM